MQIKKLKNSLEELQPNGYIALHGMKGFGKSCLTASTLKDKDFILNLFNVSVDYSIKIYKKFFLRNIYNQSLFLICNIYLKFFRMRFTGLNLVTSAV